MRTFGIIGNPLNHSFSAKYFMQKFETEKIDAVYNLYPLDNITDFSRLLETTRLAGLNVTQPYKVQIIPYLQRLDDTAQAIGAVNVVRFDYTPSGTPFMTGYNTDCLGFMNSIKPLLLPTDTNALILGTGGAAKAVVYALQLLGVQTQLVSRTSARGIPYSALTQTIIGNHSVIVNCTPLGMYPDIDNCPPFPFQWLTEKHLLFDCIYNPEETLFLKKGKEKGTRTQNGLGMLLGQAQSAWKIWES